MDPPSDANQLAASASQPRSVTTVAWNGYLKNLGVWTGNRSLVNPRGRVLIDLPSSITAEHFQTPDGDRFVQWRTSLRTADGVEEGIDEWSRSELADFAALAADGSYSIGPLAFSGEPITVDHCLADDALRIRTTHAFDWEGCLSGIVSNRERFLSTTTQSSEITPKDPPPLSPTQEPLPWRNPRILLDYTIGLWEGRGICIDARTNVIYNLTSRHQIAQGAGMLIVESSVLRIGDGGPARIYEAAGRIDGNFILFAEANVQTILLPGGVIVSSPVRIRRNRPFTIETTFLLKPDCRKRVIRLYNRDAEWINTVFINERRAG